MNGAQTGETGKDAIVPRACARQPSARRGVSRGSLILLRDDGRLGFATVLSE